MNRKISIWVGLVFASLMIAAIIIAYLEPPGQPHWYEGGNLHQATAQEWRQATHKNKLATCGDLLHRLWARDNLNPTIAARIHTMDDIKPYASTMVAQLDVAFAPNFDDPENDRIIASLKVTESAALLSMMMRWTR